VLLHVSSRLLNQQYILNKVSLNHNAPKTRLCVDLLMKMVVTRGSQEPNFVFSLGVMVQYSVFYL